MPYLLGIDLGTTVTAAAVLRLRGGEVAGEPEMVRLSDHGEAMPSVLFAADDGELLLGDAAQRRALGEPDRVAPEFKRRIGDPTPVSLGGRAFAAHELAALVVQHVVDVAARREGEQPERIALTHPAAWGAHEKELVGAALSAHGLTVTFLAEPQAAALRYTSAERAATGSTIAVHDPGGDPENVIATGAALALAPRPEVSWPGVDVPVQAAVPDAERTGPIAVVPACAAPTEAVPVRAEPPTDRFAAWSPGHAAPMRPGDTYVTRGPAPAPRSSSDARARLLIGAGGLAGALAIVGAVLFWPTTSDPVSSGVSAAQPTDAPTTPAAPADPGNPAPVAESSTADATGAASAPTRAIAPRSAEPGPPAARPAATAPAAPAVPPAAGPTGPGPVQKPETGKPETKPETGSPNTGPHTSPGDSTEPVPDPSPVDPDESGPGAPAQSSTPPPPPP